MTRRTIVILYAVCGLTGAVLAAMQNRRAEAEGAVLTTLAETKGSKSRFAADDRKRKGEASPDSSKEWQKLLREGRMSNDGSEPRPTYWLYGDHGDISEEGLKAAGLNEDQTGRVRTAMEEARDAMFALFAEGIELDKRKPKDKTDEIWYFIPSQMEEGARVFDELGKKFEAACGKEKARELVNATNPMFRYANFGRQDVSLRWSRKRVNGQEQWEGVAHFIDGPTGQKAIERMLKTPEELRKSFGDGVSWPE